MPILRPAAGDRRGRVARARAAADRLRRVEAALAVLPAAQARARRNGTTEARVSTSDAEARVMKMPGGGFRPAYNGQLDADTASQMVVGVEVSTTGSDQPNLLPVADQIERRHGRRPRDYLVDGGFVTLGAIERLDAQRVTVYAPPPTPRGPRDVAAPCEGDSPTIVLWRARMQTEAAKRIDRDRAATIKCVNAHARRRGLTAMPVRGLAKVSALALWHALAHNLARLMARSTLAAT